MLELCGFGFDALVGLLKCKSCTDETEIERR